jgi:predicted RNA-binding protein
MLSPTYWLDLFTGTTWEEFLKAGGVVSGFRESRWSTVQKMKPGDCFLCYVTGISRWIGLLEVTGEPYIDKTRIWEREEFPCRIPVKVLIQLEPETAVPVRVFVE